MESDALATTNPPTQEPISQAPGDLGAAPPRPMTDAEALAYFADGRDPEDAPDEALRIVKRLSGPVTAQQLAASVPQERPVVDLSVPVPLAPVAFQPEETPAPVAQQLPPVVEPVAPVVLTKAEQLLKMVQAGVDENVAAAVLYGPAAAAQMQQQPPVEQAPPPVLPAKAALDALDAELAKAQEALRTDPDLQYGDAATNAMNAEIAGLLARRQDAANAAFYEAREAERQQREAQEAARQNAEQAEYQGLLTRFPGLKIVGGPFSVQCEDMIKNLDKTEAGKAILAAPNFRTIVAESVATAFPALVAQQPNAPAPKFAVPPPQPVVQYHPGSNQGGPAPIQNQQVLTPDQMEALYERDPDAYEALKQRALAAVPVHGRL